MTPLLAFLVERRPRTCPDMMLLIQLSQMCVREAETFLLLGVTLNGLGDTVSPRFSARRLGISLKRRRDPVGLGGAPGCVSKSSLVTLLLPAG